MAELIEDEQQSKDCPNSLIWASRTIIMGLALVASCSLLHWGISHRQIADSVPNSSAITAELRDHQLGCLAQNVYWEAGSEPFEGKVAVAQVTLNRTNSGIFPKDICKTIFQKDVIYSKIICQFSWVCDRVVNVIKPINNNNYNESMEAAKRVLLESYRLPELENALYYHADNIDPHWGKKPLVKIGHHIFYN
jgi:spore germination cell wall hydrolase CwlJ-like protein